MSLPTVSSPKLSSICALALLISSMAPDIAHSQDLQSDEDFVRPDSAFAIGIVLPLEDLPGITSAPAGVATGLILYESDSQYTLIANWHVLNKCIASDFGECVVIPIFPTNSLQVQVPPTLEVIFPGDENGPDVGVGVFVEEAGSYSTAEIATIQANWQDGEPVIIAGFSQSIENFQEVSSFIISPENYQEVVCPQYEPLLDTVDPENIEPLLYMIDESEEKEGFVNGFSGGPIIPTGGQIIGIHSARVPPTIQDDETSDCGRVGRGVSLSEIFLVSEVPSYLPEDYLIEIGAIEASSNSSDLEEFSNENQVPYVIQLRRQRLNDPGHGSNDIP
jgi:hypothetical protein